VYERQGRIDLAIADFRMAFSIPQKYQDGQRAHDTARQRLRALGAFERQEPGHRRHISSQACDFLRWYRIAMPGLDCIDESRSPRPPARRFFGKVWTAGAGGCSSAAVGRLLRTTGKPTLSRTMTRPFQRCGG
jgi:ferric-dicitrate binding protein FerR (iron transport regulator)